MINHHLPFYSISMKTILISLLLLVSCNIPEKYKVTGVIKEINIEKNKLLIDHDEIPGFMVKMVMYFNLDQSINIDKFSINDSVSFDLIINKDFSYTLNYENLGKSKIIIDDFWEDEDNQYNKKMIGETIDDAKFLTIKNKEIKLSDLNSDLIVISYIFSKCPMPNMCPASIIKNQYLSDYFKDENVSFLLISFDYLYDTPLVLNNIYGTLEKDNLFFLSSYNHINDIFMLTQQSGVAFWGVEENNIGHSMRTIVIDKNLKLISAYDDIDWNPGEAKKDIEKILRIYK